MYKLFLILLILFISHSKLYSQSDSLCNTIKTGVFYYYSHDTNRNFIIERTDAIQKEIDIDKKDTTLWSIIWKSDCSLFLKFLRSTQPKSDAEKSFYNSNTVIVKINNITDDYYSFSGALDSLNGLGKTEDTIWRKSNDAKFLHSQ